MQMREIDRERLAKEETKTLMSLLERHNYDQTFAERDEFCLAECAICMEIFQIGEIVLRIPLCKHFFHPECCQRWFESKAQIIERKCPLCNKILDIEEIRRIRS